MIAQPKRKAKGKPNGNPLDQLIREATKDELMFALKMARSPRLLSRVEFASKYMVVPEGKYEGSRWRPNYQPYSYWLLKCMDEMPQRRYAFTGCVQSGKTFNLLINLCWHLFERKETCIYGLPSMDMARDKYMLEILPVIEASPFLRQYIPQSGPGTRGGTPSTITFRHGVSMKFMSAHGRDDKRSAITAPVVLKTEVDRFDESTLASRETDPARQMDARTESFGDQAFIYEECTVTTEFGRIWQRWNEGTMTECHAPCPHCGEYILPTRDDLHGWRDAETVGEAAESSYFLCTMCRERIDNHQRLAMLNDMIPVSSGQKIEDKTVTGKPKDTKILSFRWNAFHNAFWSVDTLGEKEWIASRQADFDSADRERRQFAWAIPSDPDVVPLVTVGYEDVLGAQQPLTMGIVPQDAEWLTVGVDLRKSQLHYTVWAFLTGGRRHLVEAQVLPVDWEKIGAEPALMMALRQLRETCNNGWRRQDNSIVTPQWVFIDSGWEPDTVFTFILECRQVFSDQRFVAARGRGASSNMPGMRTYNHPVKRSKGNIIDIGDEYYISWQPKRRCHCVFINADKWKTRLHQGFALKQKEQRGAITTYEPKTEAEMKLLQTFSRHTTAERATEQHKEDKGIFIVWLNESRRHNHFFDCAYMALAAGHYAGYRVVPDVKIEQPEGTVVRRESIFQGAQR